MITSDLPTAEAFVSNLADSGVLSPEGIDLARAWRRERPAAGADRLAAFLVEQGGLTRFQADVFLEGDPKTLSLSVYSLVDVIGAGSMGTVYKAISTRDNAPYAIKVVPRRNVVNLKKITEKVEALKQVRHPRVSALVHVGAQGDRAYRVWPLLEGGEKLDAVVKKHERLTPRQSAQIALQIAAGLQAYHAHDLFHGLLKPSDVLIGTDRRVRLLDFGVGFLLTCDRGKALLDTMTNSKALARGLDCASPEAILDPLNRTVRGDQYSLGCILYYCLAGRFPFTDANPVKKMLAHQVSEPPPIGELAPDCPERLAEIVHRLLEKQAEDRYATIEELIAELQAVTSGSERMTPSPRPAARVKQVVVAERPPAAPEPMKKDDRSAFWMTLAGMSAGGLGGLLWWLLSRP